jgi:hypothetical protein
MSLESPKNGSGNGSNMAIAAIVLNICTTILMAFGVFWTVSSSQANNSALIANYGARITNLEQERADDRRDIQAALTNTSTRLDTIVNQIGQLQVSVATKAEKH